MITALNLLKKGETATKRLSDVEKRKVEKQIKEWWNLKELREKAEFIYKFFYSYPEQVDYDAKIKQYEGLKKMQTQFWNDRFAWMKLQSEENEAGLDELDASDWEEMMTTINFYEENLKEFILLTKDGVCMTPLFPFLIAAAGNGCQHT